MFGLMNNFYVIKCVIKYNNYYFFIQIYKEIYKVLGNIFFKVDEFSGGTQSRNVS